MKRILFAVTLAGAALVVAPATAGAVPCGVTCVNPPPKPHQCGSWVCQPKVAATARPDGVKWL